MFDNSIMSFNTLGSHHETFGHFVMAAYQHCTVNTSGPVSYPEFIIIAAITVRKTFAQAVLSTCKNVHLQVQV